MTLSNQTSHCICKCIRIVVYRLNNVTELGDNCIQNLFRRHVAFASALELSLNAGQKYCKMLQGEHSAILLTFIRPPFVIKIFVLSI